MPISGRSPMGEAHHQTGSSGASQICKKLSRVSGKDVGDALPRARGLERLACVTVPVPRPHVRVPVSWPPRGFDLRLLHKTAWERDDVREPDVERVAVSVGRVSAASRVFTQSGHFSMLRRASMTSDLHRRANIFSARWHFSKVPTADVARSIEPTPAGSSLN